MVKTIPKKFIKYFLFLDTEIYTRYNTVSKVEVQ